MYKIGDKVRIVQYGHLYYMTRDEYEKIGASQKIWAKSTDSIVIDVKPELIGQVGTIRDVSTYEKFVFTVNFGKQYALEGISGKSAWYDENQLEPFIQPIELSESIKSMMEQMEYIRNQLDIIVSKL